MRSVSVFRQQMFKIHPYCQWCGCRVTEEDATTDHVIPRALGGTDTRDNFVLACIKCNHDKDMKIYTRKPFGPRLRKGFNMSKREIFSLITKDLQIGCYSVIVGAAKVRCRVRKHIFDVENFVYD